MRWPVTVPQALLMAGGVGSQPLVCLRGAVDDANPEKSPRAVARGLFSKAYASSPPKRAGSRRAYASVSPEVQDEAR
eukprot:11170689-Lingulodinium_polyedra.AAC.1